VKKNLFYLAVLTAFIMSWWLLRHRAGQKQILLRKGRHELVFPDLDDKDIAAIELEFPGQRERLYTQDHVWYLKPYGLPANSLYVEMLIHCMTSLTYGDEISSRVEDHPEYQLDARSRLVVLRNSQEAELARVYIGTPGENYRTVFFRLGDDPRVFHTVTDLFPVTSRKTWLSRGIWRVPASAVSRIEFVLNGNKKIIVRTKNGFTRGSSELISGESMQPLLQLEAGDARAMDPMPLEKDAAGSLTLTAGPIEMKLVLFLKEDYILAIRPESPRHGYLFQRDFLNGLFDAP
jgi:hypothetical protein